MNRDFKGIWIPKEIWLSEKLTLQEKVFFVEIQSLDNGVDGCYANNSYFAKFFGISTTRVSLVIKSLIEKGCIKSEINEKLGNKRMLKTSLIKVKDPLKQKLKHNNTVNNTSNDKESKFLSLFNNLKEKKTGKGSRFKTLSPADQKNFKKLQGHTVGDFTTVINTMLEADWPKQTNNQTPSHILRVENFNRYLSNPIKTTVEETDQERSARLLEEAKAQ